MAIIYQEFEIQHLIDVHTFCFDYPTTLNNMIKSNIIFLSKLCDENEKNKIKN